MKLVGFETGLRQDEAAVRAVLTTARNNVPGRGPGEPAEGNEASKQMYGQMNGRDGLCLLRARGFTRLERSTKPPGRPQGG
jgi:hypothetical protein